MRHENVTFNWSDSDPARPALAVLVRLAALTDYAVDDGDLSPYLMRPQLGGGWTLTLSLPSTLRTSYQFCPIRERDLADEIVRNEASDHSWARVMALGEPDPARPPTFTPGTVYSNPDQPPSIMELSDALPQPSRSPRPGVPRGRLTRHELAGGGGPPSVIHVHRPVPWLDSRFELLASVRALHDVLVEKSYDVRYREYEGGHDIACWRGALADGLVALLGGAGT